MPGWLTLLERERSRKWYQIWRVWQAVANLLPWRVRRTFRQKVGWGKGAFTMHLIHHILVRAPSLNSGWPQCHALGGVAKGWGNWIGIRHWVSDNKRYPSLSHGLSALLWLPGILFAHSLYSSEPSKDRRGVLGGGEWAAAHQDGLSLVVSCASRWNGIACASPCVRMREPWIPPKPRGHLCDHYHNHIKAAGD